MRDFIFLAAIALLLGCTDKELNFEFNTSDSGTNKLGYWNELKGFKNVIQEFQTIASDAKMSVPKLDFPYKQDEEIAFNLFVKKGNRLLKIQEGVFKPSEGLQAGFNKNSLHYLKLYHAKEPLVVLVDNRKGVFKIQLIKKFKS